MELKRSRGGFSLIEVMISVVIVSIVGTALLEISNKNTKIIGFLQKKREVPIFLSLFSFHENKDISGLEKNLYDVVSKKFTIESEKLKYYLGDKKVYYQESYVDRIDFGGLSKEEVKEGQEEGETQENSQQIEIYKHSIKSGKLTGSIYSLQALE